jgi:hypothetical protein
VDLNTLFPGLQLISATEMTLTANQPLSELNRLTWKTTGSNEEFMNNGFDLDDYEITLNPMETRTFLVRYQPASQYNHISVN